MFGSGYIKLILKTWSDKVLVSKAHSHWVTSPIKFLCRLCYHAFNSYKIKNNEGHKNQFPFCFDRSIIIKRSLKHHVVTIELCGLRKKSFTTQKNEYASIYNLFFFISRKNYNHNKLKIIYNNKYQKIVENN